MRRWCFFLCVVSICAYPVCITGASAAHGRARMFLEACGDVGLYVGFGLLTTTAHELAHAVAAKLFADTPIHINIGAVPKAQFGSIPLGVGDPLFESKYVTVYGLYPVGFVTIPANVSKWKKIAILAAGPIVGAAVAALPLLKWRNSKVIHASLVLMFANLINFLPFEGSDGHQILQALSEKNLSRADLRMGQRRNDAGELSLLSGALR